LADSVVTAADVAVTAASTPELWPTLLQSFGVLLLVLALMILVMWLMRRYLVFSGAAGQQGVIKMLASMYVAPKERIALVDVLGEKILIGITPQQISFLARVEDKDDMCAGRQEEKSPGGFFKALLKRKLDDDSGPSTGKTGSS
jgi:flagellar protein FliO/FliZ